MNPAEFANIARSERTLWWYRGMNEILFRLLRHYAPDRGERVLEAGCGTGYLATLLESRLGWKVNALDLGSEGLQYGRQMGLQQLVQADLSEMPLASEAFDVVLSMDVLVHFPPGEERKAAAELVRVLKADGLLFIRVSALDMLRSRHSMFAAERQRFTKRRLIRVFEEAGVKVLRCTYANSLLMPVALAKFRFWEPITRQAPASGVEPVAPWLDALLHLPLRLEASWIGAGLNFPVGQSLLLVGRKRPQAAGASDNNPARTRAGS